MKYICLGYYDKSKHDAMIEAEKQAMFDACFTYDDHSATGGYSEYVSYVDGKPTSRCDVSLRRRSTHGLG